MKYFIYERILEDNLINDRKEKEIELPAYLYKGKWVY